MNTRQATAARWEQTAHRVEVDCLIARDSRKNADPLRDRCLRRPAVQQLERVRSRFTFEMRVIASQRKGIAQNLRGPASGRPPAQGQCVSCGHAACDNIRSNGWRHNASV